MSDTDKPPFDPSAPFSTTPPKPAFDPSKPFSTSPPDEGLSLGEMGAQAIGNAPESAWQLAKDTVHPLMHPVETLGNMKDLGLGVAEKAAGAAGLDIGSEHKKYAEGMGNYLAERYGGYENLKRSFAKDPIGILADLSMIATLGGSAAERLPGVMGRAGEVMSTVGRATDPLMAPFNAAKLGRNVSGTVFAHTGAPALETAYRTGVEGGEAGEVFRDNMRGQAAMEQPVQIAKQGLEQIRQEKGKSYREDMDRMHLDNQQLNPADRILDFGKIDKAVDKALNVQTFKGQTPGSPVMKLDPGAEAVRSEMIAAIDKWKKLPPADYHTLEGIDALKKQLGNMWRDTPPNTSARTAAQGIYNAVRQTIIDFDPRYAKTMRDYERASDTIRDIEKTLSLGEKASVDTGLRKLQSILRNNVNTNYGRRLELGQLLEDNGAKHLMAALSGQAVNHWFPRGLGGLAADIGLLGVAGHSLSPTALATAPLMSPRIMGEASHLAGRTVGRALDRSNRALGHVGLSNRTLGNVDYRTGRATNDDDGVGERNGRIYVTPRRDGGAVALRIAREVGGRVPHKEVGGETTAPFPQDDSWKDREAQLGLELTGGNRQSWGDWLKSDSIAQRASDAASYVGRFARDVANAPRYIYENPGKADEIGQQFLGGDNWVANMVKSGATLPGEVYSGETPVNVTDPRTGERTTNPEVIERTQDLAGMAGGQTLATGARDAAAGTAGRDLRVLGRQVLASDTNAAGAPLAALEHAPKFYSHLDNVITDAPMEKATGAQWLGTLSNRGVKADELQWTGTKGFLEQNADQVLTKQQVQEHVGANKVELGERNKGEVADENSPAFNQKVEDILAKSREMGIPMMRSRAEDMAYEEMGYAPTKYHSYQLPGGENYRERLLTLPEAHPAIRRMQDNQRRLHEISNLPAKETDPSTPRGQEYAAEYDRLRAEQAALKDQIPPTYKSSHWDEPNILVHRRSNERSFTEPLTEEQQAVVEQRRQAQGQLNGVVQQQHIVARQIRETVKPLEKAHWDQIRADVASGKMTAAEGLRLGEQYPDFPELAPLQDKLQQLRAQEDAIRSSAPPAPEPKSIKSLHLEEIQSDWHQQGRQKGYVGTPVSKEEFEKAGFQFRPVIMKPHDRPGVHIVDPQGTVVANGRTEAEAMAQFNGNRTGVPDAPFKKNWHELALKDAIREAAEKGFDRISWTPGEAQAARYDLSKQVSRVQYNPDSGKLWGYDHHDNAVIDHRVSKDKLADFIGKDTAEKLLNSEPDKGWHTLSGTDLKVGGEGMKGFYDKIIPDAMNKIGKPHGVKVQKGETAGSGNVGDLEGPVNSVPPSRIYNVTPRLQEQFPTIADFVDYYNDLTTAKRGDLIAEAKKQATGTTPVHYMDIPQSLKDQALRKGFSLFEDSGTAGAPVAALAKEAEAGYAAPHEPGQAREAGPRAGGAGGEPGLRQAQAEAARLAAGHAPLEGLPQTPIKLGGDLYVPGPMGKIRDIAADYMRTQRPDADYTPPTRYIPVDKPHAEAIAKAFEEMKHAPDDPRVKASYQALADETAKQYQAMKQGGLQIEAIPREGPDPYAGNPRLLFKDVADNNHLWFFPTEDGYGMTGITPEMVRENPMLAKSGEKLGDRDLLVNDLFRVVHDFFGHLKEGNGFRAAGEDNAWRSHVAMYSDAARPAMTTETRGQNSWLNYGPHGETNRKASSADTVYAEQKVGLLPAWVMRSDTAETGAPLAGLEKQRSPAPGKSYFNETTRDPNAGVDAPANAKVQTVADPHRMMFPGIYRNPRQIADEAAARVGPEDIAMKRLFGVTRGDLREMAQGRVGNEQPNLKLAANPRGSISAQNIQTPQNTKRLTDILEEAGRHEGLRTADAWYIMDPAFKRMQELFGGAAAKRYSHLNTMTGMASPGSNVNAEIARGTAAHWLEQQGRFKDFAKYAGIPNENRPVMRSFPPDIRAVPGHAYHRTAQAEPMQKYLDAGSIQSDAAKVPLYVHASGVPQTGFQTTAPVGDAHFSRGVGLADTRKGPTDVGSSFSRAEYQTLQPWWQRDVAGKVGLESVPAQARLWTALGPQTGVDSALGAPKLELLSKQIMKAAHRLGVSPEKARDMVLSGEAGAFRRGGPVAATLRAHRKR